MNIQLNNTRILLLTICLLSAFGCRAEDYVLNVNDDKIVISSHDNAINVYRHDKRIAHLIFYSDQYTIIAFGEDKKVTLEYGDGFDSPVVTWYFMESDQIRIKGFDSTGNLVSDEILGE